jgi:DNA-binding NarL/FixJ family response regulator
MIGSVKNSFFLVEDHRLMRQGIVSYITKNTKFTCAGEAGTQKEFLDAMNGLAPDCMPDVLVTDLNIDGSMKGGISLIQLCRKDFPALKIIVYSMYEAISVVSTAMNAGADAYVSKLSKEEELVTALRKVIAGQKYIEPELAAKMQDFERTLSVFSKREQQILNLILIGKTNADIAQQLNLHKRTVENHICHIYDKTGLSSREELLNYYSHQE